MTNINIIYDIFDDKFDVVDIIAVPDEIVLKIEKIGQEFLNWYPPENDANYWVVFNGKKYLNKEINGFIKWLNSTYCKDLEKAQIVQQNTNYCPKYKSIEF